MTQATREPAAPEEVLSTALIARDRWDYEYAASLCHPTSVVSFFRNYCGLYDAPSLSEYLAENPGVSTEAARATLERWGERFKEQRAQLARAIPGVSDFAALTALEPRDFLRRYLEGNDPRYEIVRRLRARGRQVPDELLRTPRGVGYKMIGRTELEGGIVKVDYREVHEWRDAAGMGGLEHELLQLFQSAWRILVRPHLLHSRSGHASELPREIAEALDETAKE